MPRSIKKIPIARREAILRLLAQNLSVRQIAKDMKVDHRVVSVVKQWVLKDKKAQEEKGERDKKGIEELGLKGKKIDLLDQIPTAALASNPMPGSSADKQMPAVSKGESRKQTFLRAYRKALRKFPVEERAQVLIDVARDGSPQLKLQAVTKMDEIDGVIAATKDTKPEAPGAMFIFPQGTNMSFRPIGNAVRVVNGEDQEEEGEK